MIYQNNKLIGLTIDNTSNREVYSTEEQVIGTWIDGKPLYGKTIYGDITVEANKNVYITIDQSEVNTLISVEGTVRRYASLDGTLWDDNYIFSLPYAQVEQNSNLIFSIGETINEKNTNHAIWLLCRVDISTKFKIFVTIKYTKTTDEPTIQFESSQYLQSLADMTASYAMPVTAGGVYNEENEEGIDE